MQDFDLKLSRLVASSEEYALARSKEPHHDVEPRLKMAVVACMDSRIDLFGILGLETGDAHVLRNAGGVVTDDVIRSLVVSQRVLKTESIILMHHTDCGLQKVTDDTFKAEIEGEVGIRPQWALEAFKDPFIDVTQSAARIRQSPFIFHKELIRGFVYDVDSHALIVVDLSKLD